jgi:predicted transporter
VSKSVSKWIDFLYGPFFRVIGFFYRTYKANRDRVARFMSNDRVSAIMKLLAILFLLGWILVWMFAPEESRTRLSDEIKQTIGGFDSGSGQ